MSKRLIILGAGESGVGAALLAKAKGYDVFVSDAGEIKRKYADALQKEKISFESGKHDEEKILNSNLVIKSPGIPDKLPLIKKLVAKGIDVISEIEFAARYSKAKFIAITGSNGKTTTTLLTYHLLKKLGLNVGLAGNVGESLAKQVIEDPYDYFVLELSSFQLDGMFKFRAHIAILLNITPDHLDRYEYNIQNYINSKFKVIQNMTTEDFFICYADDPIIKTELMKREIKPVQLSISLKDKMLNGAYLTNEHILVSITNYIARFFTLEVDRLPLKGKHNLINSMSAILAATALDLNKEKFLHAMEDFKNASHRLEEAGFVNNVRFINDSKATNVDSVWYALDSLDAPIILIAGGIDKGNDYSQIEQLVSKKAKALVCLGKDNTKLHKAFDGKVKKIIDTGSMNEAVNKAFKVAKEGDIILLSPACSSFDLFKNYEDRGEQFKQAIKELKIKFEIGTEK
jgi:UDP-N-acetylmuramoylalanine--D-glutamate ligase